jgi:hypothetical protein
LETAELFVNERRLPQALQTAYVFDTERADMLVRLQVHARLCRQTVGAIRQWRAAPVPLQWLRFGGENEIMLRHAGKFPATIHGDYQSPSGKIVLPTMRYISNGRALHEIQDLDLRPVEFGTEFYRTGESYFIHRGKTDFSDLSPAPGRQSGSYRMYLMFGRSDGGSGAFERHADYAPITQRMALLTKNAPLVLSEKMKLAGKLGQAKQVQVTISLDQSKTNSVGLIAGQIMFTGVDGESYSLPDTPQFFDAKRGGEISVTVPTGAFLKGLDTVQAALFGQWVGDLDLPDVVVTVKPVVLPRLSRHTSDLY